MSFTLRLLLIFAKLICVFAKVMATTYLRQNSLYVCQYLGDGPIKGSLEQSALKQKKIPFISANLGPTVQLKVLSKPSSGAHTQAETTARQNIFHKMQVCEKKSILYR